MDLSILIVNWNTRELLRTCLESVYQNWSSVQPQVIVVDNNSSDGSVEMVRQQFPQVTLIANDENLGFVRANNQAAEAATGRYLLLLNSDTRVLDADVSRVIDYLDQHPDVGIVTGRVLNEDGSFQRPIRRKPHPVGAFMRHTIRLVMGLNTYFHRRFRMENVGPDNELDVDWVIGCYVFLRRELAENDQVFDEDIFMYYEDALLCHNCWQRGYRVRYLPYAAIIHYGGGSAKQIRAFTVWHSFRSSVIYFRKTRGGLTASIYSAGVRGAWAVFAAVFGVAGVLLGSRGRQKAGLFQELRRLSSENGGGA